MDKCRCPPPGLTSRPAPVALPSAAPRVARYLEQLRLRGVAERLLRVHPLRVADALPLAAMVEVDADGARDLDVVCFDERQAKAALREGFRVILAE